MTVSRQLLILLLAASVGCMDSPATSMSEVALSEELPADSASDAAAAVLRVQNLETVSDQPGDAATIHLTLGADGAIRSLWVIGGAIGLHHADSASPTARARRFLRTHASAFGLGVDTELSEELSADERNQVRFFESQTKVVLQQRTRAGEPIFDHEAVVVFDEEGNLRSVRSMLVESVGVRSDSTEADLVVRRRERNPNVPATGGEFGYFRAPDATSSRASHAYLTGLDATAELGIREVLDAHTGAVLHTRRVGHHANVEVWSSPDETDLTSFQLLFRDDPFFQASVMPGTSSFLRDTVLDFNSYMDVRLSRDGWADDSPTAPYHRMKATADVDQLISPSPRQAAWLPYNALGCSASSGQTFCHNAVFGHLAVCDDVVSHEFAHGIQRSELGNVVNTLPFHGGAINEGLSDIFGEFFEHSQTGAPDWYVGTGGSCLNYRSMARPESCTGCNTTETNPGPSNFNGFNQFGTYSHYNGLILGKLAYLMGREPSAGAESHAGQSVTGVGLLATESIVYRAVTTSLTGSSDFMDVRAAIYS